MTACLKAPLLHVPTLPFPLTLVAPKIVLSFDPRFCCKLPALPSVPIQIPISPLVLNPAVIAAVKTAIKAINTVLSQVQIKCPRE